MDRFEDWLEGHVPARLVGAYYWLKHRLTGERCFVCDMPFILHAPARMWECNNTPLDGLQITEQGMAALAVMEAEQVAAEAADDAA
jgi:hypothetical protein